MKKKKSALIVGAGYVGLKLMQTLASQGWSVQGIKRQPKQDHLEILSIDIKNTFTLPQGYDVIFYLASADSYTAEAYDVAYTKGVENTLQALKNSAQSPRFIFVSSTSLFAENDGGIVSESSPTATLNFATKSLAQGEQLVGQSGLPFLTVRFSGIYGPERCQLVQHVKNGQATLKINPYVSNRIHLEDCVGALIHLATLDKPHPCYIASDSTPSPYNEVLLWLSKKLGVPAPKLEESPSSSHHMSHKKCSNSQLLSSGYSFLYPSYREGLLSCL